MRRQEGLSLVELMLVMAMVAVIIGAGVGVSQLLSRSRLANAVVSIESSIGQGRQTAKREDRTVVVRIVRDDDVWYVESDGRRQRLQGVEVTTGEMSMTLNPPYGTYDGREFSIGVSAGGRLKEVVVTGVLAKTVVTR